LKADAVPGRINMVLAIPSKPGVYFGQCSELCGVGHGFMPIAIRVDDFSSFLKWIWMQESLEVKLLPVLNDAQKNNLNILNAASADFRGSLINVILNFAPHLLYPSHEHEVPFVHDV